jgi:hypothetical protein
LVENSAYYFISGHNRFPLRHIRFIIHWSWYILTLVVRGLTLNPPTWKIWWAPNNAKNWQMGFNLAFRGLSCWERRLINNKEIK